MRPNPYPSDLTDARWAIRRSASGNAMKFIFYKITHPSFGNSRGDLTRLPWQKNWINERFPLPAEGGERSFQYARVNLPLHPRHSTACGILTERASIALG